MSTVIADATLPAKLAALTEPTEIVDEQGRKLGRFTPEAGAKEPYCPWDLSLTPEEADRFAAEPEGYTLDEILRELDRQ